MQINFPLLSSVTAYFSRRIFVRSFLSVSGGKDPSISASREGNKIELWGNTVKLDFKELLIKEQIDFKELFTDYQLFYTINLLLNKELLPI